MPSLTLLAHYRDNQDGSTCTTFYNNEAELDESLRKNHDAYCGEDEELLTAVKIREEDDPYEDGYIDDVTFELSIDDLGNYSLTKPISIGFG